MYDIADVETFICEYISEQSDVSAVTSETDFVEEELLDSFGILSLIMTLESKYNIRFSPELLADTQLRKVSNMSLLVVNLLNK